MTAETLLCQQGGAAQKNNFPDILVFHVWPLQACWDGRTYHLRRGMVLEWLCILHLPAQRLPLYHI